MRYLPLGVVALGALGIGAMAAYRPPAPVTSALPHAEIQSPEPSPTATALPVAASGLFGQEAPPETPVARQTLPPLTLTGIMQASSPERSQALIREADGSVGFYRIGDVVVGPFILADIGSETATLSDGADRHVLAFDAVSGGASPRMARATEREVPYQTAAHRAISAPLEAPQTTEEHIAYWRERIRRNPGEVLTEIGLEPGEDGYRIARTQNIGVRLAGFRTGDLITSVNGIPVGNADEDRKKIDAILAEGLARVTFERGGETRDFTFPLR